MEKKERKFKLPRIRIDVSKPGQSMGDFEREMAAKDGEGSVPDLSADEFKKMVQEMDIDLDDIEPSDEGGSKKTPGLVKRMLKAFWE
jgi:hypothetical protein